jgi:DNA mismatch endonuclease (patch repair protein)
MSKSWASSDATRRSMQGNRGRDTKPELAVRRLLHAEGLRYRVDYRLEPSLRTRPDIVFTRARVTVFIDGCFWHGCPQHHTVSSTNAPYWADKVTQNGARDTRNSAALTDLGWTVLRFWEHEDPKHVATVVAEAVRTTKESATPGTRPSPPSDA